MTDEEYDEFMSKCLNAPYKDYSWLKEHCYRVLKNPCSPNVRNEHLAVLDLIKEHEEQQSILDKIRAELHATSEMHEDGHYYLREEWVDEIIDKYMEVKNANDN